jgi:EAL domain-containing protein (putative c-di-GMP-specific phosphodiesterase class I)
MRLRYKIGQVVESGIQPITFQYDTVHFFDESPSIKRSFLQINSQAMGTLTYRQYRFLARRSKQGDALVRRHLHGLLRGIPSFSDKEKAALYTMPVYARTLQDGKLAEILFEGFSLFPKVAPNLVCMEFSADLLYENVEVARERIDALRSLGVKIAVGEVGDEFCPVFRLAALQFDYAFLDEYAIEHLLDDNAEQSVGALIAYLHTLQVRVIAPNLLRDEQIERARALGCDGYTSPREEVA